MLRLSQTVFLVTLWEWGFAEIAPYSQRGTALQYVHYVGIVMYSWYIHLVLHFLLMLLSITNLCVCFYYFLLFVLNCF